MSEDEPAYRTACLRLPDFPLQWLKQRRPHWRGKPVAWLEQLKPDSPLRYLSPEGTALGLSPGLRYATALGLVPDLLAGTSDDEELAAADKRIIKELHRFTPSLRRGSGHVANGLYLLDASGLSQAFGGMTSWARQLMQALERLGWEARLTVGFTPFACEMATYTLDCRRPYRLFRDRQEEQEQTLKLPLSTFGLSPEQVHRLRRFGVKTLESFLSFEAEEVRRRFGADLVEFYDKAADALFAEFDPLPEAEPLWAQFGLPEPIVDLQAILEIVRYLLDDLLPRLIRKEEGVSQFLLWLVTEEGEKIEQRLFPSYPTVDAAWLGQLLRLRLEGYFLRHPLRWGRRIERIVVALVGEPDPERQGELFTDWTGADEEALLPRDREAALWALSRIRAEYGEGCLRRAHLKDHAMPGRDFAFLEEKESPDWFKGAPPPTDSGQDLRVRRHLTTPLPIAPQDRWQDKEGPFFLQGGWWEKSPFSRQYFFAREGVQTGWLYWDERTDFWFAQGWLQ